jgi:hypothetical protein
MVVAKLCRALIEAGRDPAAQLEVYRGDVLCLTVRTLGDGVALELTGGMRFVRAVR